MELMVNVWQEVLPILQDKATANVTQIFSKNRSGVGGGGGGGGGGGEGGS